MKIDEYFDKFGDMRLKTFVKFMQYLNQCYINNKYIYQGGFARYSGMMYNNANKIIKAIEQLGIIERNDVKDRCKYYDITDKGYIMLKNKILI